MPRLRWYVWVGIWGGLSLVWGVAWLAIWSHSVQGDPSIYWLTMEQRPPLAAQLMVWGGALLSVVAAVASVMRWFGRKIQS